jgi:uncharacterized protein (DUF1697 family)/uncharacterized protein YdhG (YjbR/CyaY superfamily)
MTQSLSKDPKKNLPAKDVDGYLAALPKETRVMLEKLRKTIQAAAPMAEEVISYRMPAYKYHGPLVFFAAFKDHCSLFAVGKAILKQFGDELRPFVTSGTTIHFTADRPLPAALVRKIVKARIEENASRLEPKQRGGGQFIAFLRGINVGGHAIIKMGDLKKVFEEMGLENVRTILASGNVTFEAARKTAMKLTPEIESALRRTFKKEINVIIRSRDDLVKLQSSEPFKGIKVTPQIRLYVTFLSGKVKPRTIKIPWASPEKDYRILGATATEVFSVLDLSKGKGTPDAMKVLEQEFGTKVTTRNWNSILKTLV